MTACCHQRPRPGKPVVEVDLVSEYTVLQVLNTMAWRGNACWCVAVFLRSHAHACACLLMLARARVCERPSVLLVLCWWASFAELYASNQSCPPGRCPGFSLHSRPGYSARAFLYMPSTVKPCEWLGFCCCVADACYVPPAKRQPGFGWTCGTSTKRIGVWAGIPGD